LPEISSRRLLAFWTFSELAFLNPAQKPPIKPITREMSAIIILVRDRDVSGSKFDFHFGLGRLVNNLKDCIGGTAQLELLDADELAILYEGSPSLFDCDFDFRFSFHSV
jgi:hypothetical protein